MKVVHLLLQLATCWRCFLIFIQNICLLCFDALCPSRRSLGRSVGCEVGHRSLFEADASDLGAKATAAHKLDLSFPYILSATTQRLGIISRSRNSVATKPRELFWTKR